MDLKYTQDLSNPIYRHAREIREEVFIQEQGIPPEIEIDQADQNSWHFVIYNQDHEPLATLRVQEDQPGLFHLQRLAVRKNARGQSVGQQLLEKVEQVLADMGGQKIYLDSQDSVLDFYKKSAYRVVKPVESESGIPHHRVEKEI